VSRTIPRKAAFARFFEAWPAGRLHFAAHSHHPWPDVSFDAQRQAWLDASRWLDAKWEQVIFADTLPRAQRHIARLLNLPDPRSLCFAPNTHELLMRLLSAVPRGPMQILTTDSEFRSFSRQIRRLEEAGYAQVRRIASEPFETFYFSQVFYDSGYVVNDLPAIVAAVRDAQTPIVIDGYHGFMALPTDLSLIADRVFYLSGGYKYAMAGEGVCFMHCPPGQLPRPLDTGWYAEFDALSAPNGGVAYHEDGRRFFGATFDPTGLYRFNAVMDWLLEDGLTPTRIHDHAWTLQAKFIAGLMKHIPAEFVDAELLPAGPLPRGNFLTFRHPRAADFCRRLQAQHVVIDHRGDRLRIGFGLYHDEDDVADLLRRMQQALGQ
jgi:kynureninase